MDDDPGEDWIHVEAEPVADPGAVSENRAVALLPPSFFACNTNAANLRRSGGPVSQILPTTTVFPGTKSSEGN